MASLHPALLPLLLLLGFLFASIQSAVPDLVSEREALLVFRRAVGPLLPWNLSVSPCAWRGVSCASDNVTVIALRVPGSGLRGQVPTGVFSNLTGLQTVSLRSNALSGPLPADLASCVGLRVLRLQGNRFSGTIDVPVLSLVNLVRLDLSVNSLSGMIPEGLNNLTKLKTLFLQNNSFTGELPNLNLPNLDDFNVSYNNLSGPVPPILGTRPEGAFMGTSLCGSPLPPCPVPPITSAPSPQPGGSGGGKKKLSAGAIAVIAIACVVVFLILMGLLLFCLRGRRSRSRTSAIEGGAAKPPESVIAVGNVNGSSRSQPPSGGFAASAGSRASASLSKNLVFFGDWNRDNAFDLEDLLRASAEVLGKGTFGTTYKALLEMGLSVAVKRLKEADLKETEFKERIELVGKMEHPNLVPLRAYYYSKDEKLLVYEFMDMRSLSALLHGNRGLDRTPLDWETRLAIAASAARGLQYIHSTGPGVSHGNVKSSNVLAKSYDARISEQGLAQLASPTATSNRAAGYRAPEVVDTRKVSQKADVYSFGVLLLELLTGKAPTQALVDDDGVDLLKWVQTVARERGLSEVFDAELSMHQDVEEEMKQLLDLATKCTAQYPEIRPTMAEVAAQIEVMRKASFGPDESSK